MDMEEAATCLEAATTHLDSDWTGSKGGIFLFQFMFHSMYLLLSNRSIIYIN